MSFRSPLAGLDPLARNTCLTTGTEATFQKTSTPTST